MKLSLSVSSDYLSNLSPEAAVDTFDQAGFSFMELGMGHGKNLLAREGSPEKIGIGYAAYAADKGFAMPQGHLIDVDLCAPGNLDLMKRWLDLFLGAGVKQSVLHAFGALDQPLAYQREHCSEALRKLTDHLAGTDMTICLENLFSKPLVRDADGILDLIRASGSGEHLGVCLDIGHLHRLRSHGLTEQTATEFIAKAGDRLKALHIHDNHGDTDDHLLPFTDRGLDWAEFMQALSANGYKGLFNFEIHMEARGVPSPVRILKLGYVRTLADYLLGLN